MPSRTQILLVEDDVALLRLLAMRLRAAGHTVETAENGELAIARLPVVQPRLVVTDLRMAGADGMAVFNAVRARSPGVPVIIITAHGTIPDAVQAIQSGVFGYLTKPFDSGTLLKSVEEALRLTGAAHAATGGEEDADWRREIIGRSAAMDDVLQQARLIADSDVSVLIQGESGTGKELLARAIHRASPRREHPFVAMNCTAIPETLMESELFGHVRGAFTGATQNRTGLFQTATRGTILLDEIGDMPASLQAKLLRVLQEKEFRPVGSDQAIRVDVRVVSATHNDLDAAVANAAFREDLYYRLNVVTLKMPPLRERPEDIPLLAAHFLQAAAERSGKDAKAFAPQAMELLAAAPWPGNVRQLQNVVEQTFALSPTAIVPPDLVQRALKTEPGPVASLAERRGEFERDYLVRLLRMTLGNVSSAARMAQRNRTEFYKLLNRHGLRAAEFRNPPAS